MNADSPPAEESCLKGGAHAGQDANGGEGNGDDADDTFSRLLINQHWSRSPRSRHVTLKFLLIPNGVQLALVRRRCRKTFGIVR